MGSAAISAPGGCLDHLSRGYGQLHADMLAGRRPTRWLIASCTSGLADCLTGAITSFYVALLTQRAFVMFYGDRHLQYEWAYDQPHIKWTVPAAVMDVLLAGRYRSIFDPPSDPGPDNPLVAALARGQIHRFYSIEEYLQIFTNAGLVVRHMVGNKRYRSALRDVGITATNAYQCAYAFLFSPKAELRHLVEDEVAAITQPGHVTIGVHVRAGDDVLSHKWVPNDSEVLSWVQPYLECVYTLASLVGTLSPRQQVGGTMQPCGHAAMRCTCMPDSST